MQTNINSLDPNGRYTYADYLTWRFDEMVEIIRGRLYRMSPAPSRLHQQVQSRLMFEISDYFKQSPCQVYLAPFDVRLLDSTKNTATNNQVLTVVQPDLCVVCDIEKLDDAGCVGAPDWIIEILSPATRKKDMNEKMHLYEENAVKEYWIVAPFDQFVTVYILDESTKKYAIKGQFTDNQKIPVQTFEGLTIDLSRVF